jgi:hypothetical protein
MASDAIDLRTSFRMSAGDSIPHPLSVGLRNSRQCRLLAGPICEFENLVFGPDFACDPESIQSWFDSGCLFCAAVCGEAVAGREHLLSIISALLTSEASRDRMLRGEITDEELTPWSQCSDGSRPVVYFASVISDNPGHLSTMYDSLGDDLLACLVEQNLETHSAFSVASGEAGFRHMARNGFAPASAAPYLGRYQLMTLDYATARTPFWRRVLCPASMRGVEAVRELSTEAVALNDAGLREPDAREVERRLAMSKAERYRQKTSF